VKFRLALLGLLALLSSSANAQFIPNLDDPLLGYRKGGKFYRFDPAISEFNQSGKLVRLEGSCASACTMFLSVRNACVDPNATFLFHAGRDRNRMLSASATEHMLRTYHASLRNFLIANHYMDTFEFHAISGSDMIRKFGYRACPSK